MEFAVELDMRVCPQRLHDLNLFARSLATVVEILVQTDELDFVPSDANAKPQPPTREFVERCRLLCHQDRLALSKNQHAGREADLLSATGEKSEQDERIVVGVLGRADALVVPIKRSRHRSRSREHALTRCGIRTKNVVRREEIRIPQALRRLRVVANYRRTGADINNRNRAAEQHGCLPRSDCDVVLFSVPAKVSGHFSKIIPAVA